MASRRILAAVIVLGVLAPACNSRLLRPPATIFVDGGEGNVTPAASTEQRSFPAVLLSFFPSTIQLHASDGLRFEMRYNGEPHSVAMGTLIDKALRAVERLSQDAGPAAIEKLPEMRKIPQILPSVVTDRSPKVNRSAAERCFMDEGEPPNAPSGGAPPCRQREQPDFDGKQSFYSSGFLPEGEGFRMRLSGDIKPGTYRFMCLVHRAGMRGAVEVVAPGTDRPPVAKVKLAGRDEQRVVTAAVGTSATDAVRREGGPILAGTGPEGEVRGYVAGFVPDLAKVRVGETVSWRLFETHSISFKPERRARDGILIQERSGEVKINLDAWRAVGGPQPPSSVLSYPPSTEKVVIDGGTYTGEGPFSSGIIRAIPPASVTYRLRFTEPGTYSYVCLVHDGMRGRIEVS